MQPAQSLRDLIEHIVGHHHSYVRRETPRIEALLTRVVHSPEIALIEDLFTAIGQELSTHMLKEEQVLFPYVSRLEEAVQSGAVAPVAFFESVTRPIATMIAEHDDAEALLLQIRQLLNGYSDPRGAGQMVAEFCQALEEFERDLHEHIRLENEVLFPRTIELERCR
jgi:regulator of cell morphogenesis and NO signaling